MSVEEQQVPTVMREMQNTIITMPDPCGHDSSADWLRAWPFGPIHYSENWTARLDGRFDTVCGKSPLFWPEIEWPEHRVCPACKAWVEQHDAHAHMRYAKATS